MKVVGVLPAKGTSSRIDSKNIKVLGTQPLFKINLQKLVSSTKINETYLDTESEEIIKLASDIDCKIFKRDSSLASNNTDGNQLLLNFANHITADIYVMLLCTAPFISVESINKAVEILEKEKDFDSVVAVRREKLYLWNKSGPLYDVNNIPNSYNLNDTIIETMSLYAIRRETLLKTKRRVGETAYLLNLSSIESFDINYPEDFIFAEALYNGLHN